MNAKILGFQSTQELYREDVDFKEIIQGDLKASPYTIQEGFLFKNNKLCEPKCPLRELLVREAYEEALAGHFGLNKTLDILKKHFYWPRMGGDVHRVISACSVYHKAKS